MQLCIQRADELKADAAERPGIDEDQTAQAKDLHERMGERTW